MDSDEICVIGVGTSEEFGFSLGKSPLRLQAEAFSAALRDAGLDKTQIDGIATSHGSPTGVDYEEFVVAAGLDTRWATQTWSHGRWAATLVATSALAVSAGLVDYVAVLDTTVSPKGYSRYLARHRDASSHEGARDIGGGHGEWDIHGFDTPGAATALVAQRYMDRYGADSQDLANIAIAFRAHAQLNPMAIMRNKPMSRENYFTEPVIARPFRRADYCLRNDGSCCLILTTFARARELRSTPVRIAGMEGIRTSRDDYVLFSRPGLGLGIESASELSNARPPAIYARSGFGRQDIDGLYLYDSFASNVWMVLERFGFCKEGEAPAIVTRGIGPSDELPINTNGGLMSEAHLSGYAHLIEMVRQLRNDGGPRQIPNATTLQWATPRGDSVILTRAGTAP